MLDVDYQLIDTEEKRSEIIQKLLTTEILSIDTETTGTEPMEAELVGMSFSNAETGLITSLFRQIVTKH